MFLLICVTVNIKTVIL